LLFGLLILRTQTTSASYVRKSAQQQDLCKAINVYFFRRQLHLSSLIFVCLHVGADHGVLPAVPHSYPFGYAFL
jgi:hypothetical protein